MALLPVVSRIPSLYNHTRNLLGAGKRAVQGSAVVAGVGAGAKVAATGAVGYTALDFSATDAKSAAAVSAANNASPLGIPSFQQRLNGGATGFENSIRPEYKIHFMSEFLGIDNTPIRVSAFLPETISVDISSSYRAPFDESVFGSDLTGNVLRAMGNTGVIQEMTFKIWESSNGLTFNIPIQFIADDEYEGTGGLYDINIPILNLKKLCATSKIPGSTFLRPPGPSLKFRSSQDRLGRDIPNELTTDQGSTDTDSFGAQLRSLASSIISGSGSLVDRVKDNLTFDKRTSVYIGEFLTLDNVVVENVSSTYDMVLGPNRKPLRASVNVTFSTAFTPTIQDLNAYYNYSSANIPNATE